MSQPDQCAGMSKKRSSRTEMREAAAARVRLLREAVELSGSEIARRLGIASQTWSDYELGLRGLPPDIAARLRTMFGVSLDWIYTGDESNLQVRFAEQLRAARGKATQQQAGSAIR